MNKVSREHGTDGLIYGKSTNSKVNYVIPARRILREIDHPVWQNNLSEIVQKSLSESKTARFSPFFPFSFTRQQLRAFKNAKTDKKQPFFDNGRESWTSSYFLFNILLLFNK